MVNTSFKNRAIEWLNKQKPDFHEGVNLLEQAGFKPGVVRVLRRQGPNGPETMERLRYNILEYARSMENHTPEDTDAELHVFQGQEASTVAEDVKTDKHSIMYAIRLSEDGEAEYFGNVKTLLNHYSEVYKKRSEAEYELTELPEDNDESIIEQRKQLLASIDECTDELERLYPYWVKYTTEGIEPTEEELEGNTPAEEPAEDDEEEDAATSYEGMSKEELQKLRKSVATKISRAQNMLLYQTETKQDVENPLTDPYKITKYNAKIERLSEQLDAIKMAIAKFG